MNNLLQKSLAPFRPFFGIFKENSAANFSGRTNFCRAPFEFCGRNFGPLATLCKTFELTLNKSAKVPLRLLSVFYFPQSKIEYRRSKKCSAGYPPPFVNPGLKCTWAAIILKKFD
jgi:hypothetical protein